MLWFIDSPLCVPRLLSLTCLARIYHCPGCQWTTGVQEIWHTQSFITQPWVSTGYPASQIIKRSTDTELWATDPSGDLNMSNVSLAQEICVLWCYYTTSQLVCIIFKTTDIECCQLTLFEVEFIHFVNFTVDIVWGSANYFPTFCDFWSNWEYPRECDKLSYVFLKIILKPH